METETVRGIGALTRERPKAHLALCDHYLVVSTSFNCRPDWTHYPDAFQTYPLQTLIRPVKVIDSIVATLRLTKSSAQVSSPALIKNKANCSYPCRIMNKVARVCVSISITFTMGFPRIMQDVILATLWRWIMSPNWPIDLAPAKIIKILFLAYSGHIFGIE